MVEAYKVGVTFALNNLVSAELLKMAGQFEKINAAAKAFQATLKSMSGIGGAGIFAGMSASATAMGDSFKYAATEIDGVRAKLNGLKQTAGSGNVWGSGIVTKAGNMASSAAWMATGYGAYESMRGAMSMEDTVARAMIAMGIKIGPDYMGSPMAGSIQKSIFDTTTGFGVGQADTQEAALRALRGLAPLSSDQRMKLLPAILRFAGAEVLGKHGTSMEEAVDAGIGLAHQLTKYSPEEMEPILGAFAKLSMATPQSLAQMGKSSSYYLPLLTKGLNMDPTELLALGVAGSQMGLNTKAGTWMRQMFEAPFASDLTSKRSSERRKALEELGLVKDGKPVTRDAFEFLRILNEHASAMAPEQRMLAFIHAFGQQGSGAASLYSDPTVMANVLKMASGLTNAPTPEELKKQYANSPLVQFDVGVQKLMETLTELGKTVTPQAVQAINIVIDALHAITPIFKWVSDILGSGRAVGGGSIFGVVPKVLGALANGSPLLAAPPSGNGQPLAVTHQTVLDGTVIGESTAKIWLNHLEKASPSGNGYDSRMSPLVTGH